MSHLVSSLQTQVVPPAPWQATAGLAVWLLRTGGLCSPPAPEVRLDGFIVPLAKTTWRFHRWEKPF